MLKKPDACQFTQQAMGPTCVDLFLIPNRFRTSGYLQFSSENRKSWNRCGFRTFTGPSGETWTHDPLTPSQVRYQLRYTRIFAFLSLAGQLLYTSIAFKKKQPLFSIFLNFFTHRFWKFCWQTFGAYGIITKCLRFGHSCRFMERCPSGWRNRSWKPATRKRPWVRIPLSPPTSYRSAEVPKRPKGLPC